MQALKSGGGKSKGSAFERQVCRRLSLWLSQGTRDDLLWRSAMSGGRATIQMNSGKVNLTQSGDISAIALEAYEFCQKTFVEVKHYKDLSIDRGFICNTGNLAKFWRTARWEAIRYRKQPLLIARQNLYPTLAITDRDAGIFSQPIIELTHWWASVFLFDEVTRVRTKLVRRSN